MKVLNTTDKNKCNCVLWLRDRLPELPYGLWTLDDKKAIINSSTPVVGSGAMSKDGVWFTRNGKRVFSGHVALVVKVIEDIITIHEANYQSCAVTEREGTMDQLKLVGFFVPEHLINNEETMNKDFVKEVSKICGEDYGDNINDNEQKDAAKKLKKYRENFNSEEFKTVEDKVKRVTKQNETLQKVITDLRETHKKETADLIEEQQKEIDRIKDKCNSELKDGLSYYWNGNKFAQVTITIPKDNETMTNEEYQSIGEKIIAWFKKALNIK